MTQITIRDAEAEDFGRIVELNEAEVQQTSPMNLHRLNELALMSCYHKVALADGRIAAFLLAMRENAPYQNENYAWFSARFPKFLYVDRIVVGSEFAGLKIGSLLYTELFSFARSQDISTVTCEYNVQPPNLASKRFHDRFGFEELDTQWVANGTKKVSLQAAKA
jgi:predicted GNAT superfamily acetyltransferase